MYDRSCVTRIVLASVAALSLLAGCERHHVAVTTYHGDNLRTGWNPHEEKLDYDSVQSPHFGLLQSVALDDQVDTQPLVVPKVVITAGTSPGKHEVVYVATEGNTVYALDANTGAILLSRNLGAPVPWPLGCGNNGPHVGIDGTPVIHRESGTMYVIVYTLEAGIPIYRVHALDIGSLADKVAPAKVVASHTLTDGSTYRFDASVQRQRPGLLLSKGNLYAGFGSFCDFRGDVSRGWVLGWKASTLTALAANQLNDTQATSPDTFFLSSVWMSGYGLAADETGSVFFTTGNSDTTGAGVTTYDGHTNIQESVVKVASDLTKIKSIFTPSNVGGLDQADWDYGSGGAMLVPHSEDAKPELLAASGKDGRMFVLDQDSLGGYAPGGPDKYLVLANIGQCWCGPSYFDRKIVSSGGSSVILWKIETTPSLALTNIGSSAAIGGAQDGGFFTSVSSDDKRNPIIWAVSRPDNSNPAAVTLYAFKGVPSSAHVLDTLFHASAGTWPNTGGNANIVPVVANAKVYVASYKQLTIFGLH